ncbi:hypothetical protein B0H19DRAFT_482334 [Mycena capillaripes]|nr:hypothetical protein B0H19DRAFT_482334 [Mycena capillaripes]
MEFTITHTSPSIFGHNTNDCISDNLGDAATACPESPQSTFLLLRAGHAFSPSRDPPLGRRRRQETKSAVVRLRPTGQDARAGLDVS